MTRASSAAESLRRALVEEIDSGARPAGSRLGSERELAVAHGVSRGTLRHVLGALEEAGLVRRVPGRGGGTFVSHAKVERNISEIHSVPRYLTSQGYQSESRVLSTRITVPPPRVRGALSLNDGQAVVEIRRIRLADGSPISLDLAYFSAELFPGLLEQPLGGSLYDILRSQYNILPEVAEEQIEVVHATDEEASLLSVEPDMPLLLVRRITYGADDAPFEYSKDLFRADRTRIRMRTPGRGIRGQAVRDGDVLEMWTGERKSVG